MNKEIEIPEGYEAKIEGNKIIIKPINNEDEKQKEQKKPVDLVAELKHHLETTPKEQLEKEWKELEPWGKIGPTVKEFLYGRPERKFKVGDSIRHTGRKDGVEKAVVKEISETSYYCETPRGTATIPFSAEDGYELDIKPMWTDEDELAFTVVNEHLDRFGGRGTTEMQKEWLSEIKERLCAITYMGGQGKSSIKTEEKVSDPYDASETMREKERIDEGFTDFMQKGLRKKSTPKFKVGDRIRTLEKDDGGAMEFDTVIYDNPEMEEQPVECDKETDIQKAFREGQNAGRQEVFDNPGAYGLEKIDNVFGFRIGDKVRLVDGDGRPHIIKMFVKIEGLHGQDFYRVVFEDNTASCHIFEYPNGYIARIEKVDEQKEQKPAEEHYDLTEILVPPQLSQNLAIGDSEKPVNREDLDLTSEELDKISHALFNTYAVDSATFLVNKIKTSSQPNNQHIKWGEGEQKVLDTIIKDYEDISKSFCGNSAKIEFLKSLKNGEYGLPNTKSSQWSEEDDQLIGFIFDMLNVLVWRKDWAMSKEECLERLKSLHQQHRW